MLGYYSVRFISWIVCRLPLCMQKGLANVLGSLAVRFCPQWRLEMAKANIGECLGVGKTTSEKIAEDSLRRFGRMVVEFLRFPLLTKDNVFQWTEIEGREYLDEAFQQGHGGIMATAHFGNWELLGATVSLLGFPLVSIARHQNDGGMNRFVNEYREMAGQKIAYNRGENNFLKIVRLLKQKHLVGVLFDQDTNDIGVRLDLFGKTCIVPDGAAALSRLNKAPILPLFIHNEEWGRSKIKIYPPMYCQGKEDYDRVMHELVGILEQEIRERPSMWFWVHDRWKDGHQRFDKDYDEHRHGHHP